MYVSVCVHICEYVCVCVRVHICVYVCVHFYGYCIIRYVLAVCGLCRCVSFGVMFLQCVRTMDWIRSEGHTGVVR